MDTLNVFEFLERIITLIKKENILNPTDDLKVINYKDPLELKDAIDLSLKSQAKTINELEEICKKIIKYSVKTNSKMFHNQLYGGTDLFGLGAAWLSESLNTNQHTFEVAPVFSLIEQIILKEIQILINYENGDGIFSPGGSISNMYGMVLARYHKLPQVKSKGLSQLPTLVGFVSENVSWNYFSENAHYSFQKAAHWLGIGTDNLIKIKTDGLGKMIPAALESAIIENLGKGFIPFFVAGTAGTTVLGAIDPLEQLADICEKYQLWFHIDACYGGTFLLSKTHSQKLASSNRSDSFCWNPHKMLGAPLQCSVFLTKHNKILYECNSASAVYLFQADKFYDVSYDSGDKSIQCGRKVDSFKLWTMWKARGLIGFESLIDNAVKCAAYFKNKIEEMDGFRLVLNHIETTTICFWYIPSSLRNHTEDEAWWNKLSAVAPLVKERLVRNGHLMIGYSPLASKHLCNFFRMVTTCHPVLNYSDMDNIIKEIKQFSEDL